MKRLSLAGGRMALAVLLVHLICASVAHAAVVYVRTDGSDTNSGSSWALAKKTVQAGIDSASSGDEVWVAAGTYYECVTLKDSIKLYGGFPASGGDWESRAPKKYESVLERSLEQAVITIPPGCSNTTTVDGMVIMGGKKLYGDDIYAEGGIYCCNASPKVTNNLFKGNSTAINCKDSSVVVDGNIFIGNGSGLQCYGCDLKLLNNKFLANGTLYPATGLSTQILINDSSADVKHNLILGNCNRTNAGIACIFSKVKITNNVLAGNRVEQGLNGQYSGILRCNESAVDIINNTIVHNSTKGAISLYCPGSRGTISNNILSCNLYGAYNSSWAPENWGQNIVFRNNCAYSPYRDYPELPIVNGSISSDPKIACSGKGIFHLLPNSPCIDAGDDTSSGALFNDLDGEPRLQGSHVDIGVDESDGKDWPLAPTVVIKVKPTGDDANDGASWYKAKKTVQAAIDEALLQGGEVWVAAGTYQEKLIRLHAFTSVYGGFAGFESVREQRNYKKNLSVIACDSHSYNSQLCDEGICAVSGYRTSLLDGFSIFNSHGSAITAWGGSLIISHNTIERNRSSYGAIYTAGTSPVIEANLIYNNFPSGIACYGGSPSIRNNTIRNNQKTGIYSQYSNATVENNSICYNKGYPAGAIYCRYGQPTIRRNRIEGNETYKTDIGGATIVCLFGSAVITDNIIANNFSANTVTAIACTSSGNDIDSAPIGGTEPNPLHSIIANNTIVGNISTSSNQASALACTGSTRVANNIIAFNSGGIGFTWDLQKLELRNNCIYNPEGQNYASYYGELITPGIGDFSADPLFRDAANGDYHLSPNSPCINTGTNDAPGLPELDIDGQVRICWQKVDVGADEYWPIPVQIDILPGISPNIINPKSQGKIPVAILSGNGFDATTINSSSIDLAGAKVASVGKGNQLAQVQDVDGDGDLDLLTYFQVQSLSLQGAENLTLTGRVKGGGDFIEGSDSITLQK